MPVLLSMLERDYSFCSLSCNYSGHLATAGGSSDFSVRTAFGREEARGVYLNSYVVFLMEVIMKTLFPGRGMTFLRRGLVAFFIIVPMAIGSFSFPTSLEVALAKPHAPKTNKIPCSGRDIKCVNKFLKKHKMTPIKQKPMSFCEARKAFGGSC